MRSRYLSGMHSPWLVLGLAALLQLTGTCCQLAFSRSDFTSSNLTLWDALTHNVHKPVAAGLDQGLDHSICHRRMHDEGIQRLTETAPGATQSVEVFILNVRPSRCVQMQLIMAKTGMGSHLVAASHIESLFLKHLRQEGLIGELDPHSARWVAVWRSHRAVWDYVNEHGLAQALILEDDVDVEQDILQTVNHIHHISEQLPPWDLLYLGTILAGLNLVGDPVPVDETHAFRRATNLYATHAYIVSAHAAQFLLQNLRIDDVIQRDFDVCIAAKWYNDHDGKEGGSTLIPLVLQPAVVVQLPNLPGVSDINPDAELRGFDRLQNGTRQAVMLQSMNEMWDAI